MSISRDIPIKANNVIHIIMVVFLLIALRILFLTTIKYDEYKIKALKPQQKVIIEPALRGTIRDRFGIPLAINKPQYNACICYDLIRDIPRRTWVKDKNGNKKCIYERCEYIKKFAQTFSKHLGIDSQHIMDLIYSQAIIFPRTPFKLKEDLPEELYYKLRFIEKDWVGLKMEKSTKRHYPNNELASDILGYIGAINDKQYHSIVREISYLRNYINDRKQDVLTPLLKGYQSDKEIQERLETLEQRAYTIHAYVGKSGVERSFDESLRGLIGKKHILVGSKGQYIKDLPGGFSPQSGNRVYLALSSELQKYAEELLLKSEYDRERHFFQSNKNSGLTRSPLIKGGAIVAMVPSTGEIVTMATYPKFNPNSFIITDKNRETHLKEINMWLENASYIGDLWDGHTQLQSLKVSSMQKTQLTFSSYLDFTLSKNCQVKKNLQKINSLYQAIDILQTVEKVKDYSSLCSFEKTVELLYDNTSFLNSKDPLLTKYKKKLNPFLLSIPSSKDRLLFLDILHLFVQHEKFHGDTIEESKRFNLESYRKLGCALNILEKELKTKGQSIYFDHIFPIWRNQYFKSLLKLKREDEQVNKTYVRPYTRYLNESRKKLFSEFWEEVKWELIENVIKEKKTPNPEIKSFLFHLSTTHSLFSPKGKEAIDYLKKHFPSINFLKTISSFKDLKDPLYSHYFALKTQDLQGLARAFYPKNGFGYGKSFAYANATPLGSLFKVVTGYEALKQSYQNISLKPNQTLSPLEIIDEVKGKTSSGEVILGRYLDGKPITRRHKGGRMPKSYSNFGHVDFRKALERSSNIYFSLLAGEVIKQPTDLQTATLNFGFGKKTGIELPGEIGGVVPSDIRYNQTGLYAFAIGQHSLVVTPLQSTCMLASIGNKGEVLKPLIVLKEEGKDSIKHHTKSVKRKIDMPTTVRKELIEGMKRVVVGEHGPAQPHKIRSLFEHPQWKKDYLSTYKHFIGKTSTAEFSYRPFLDREGKTELCKDTWFGALSFKDGEDYRFDMPDLSVVIYLKFGDYGKEAAPLAALMIKKWKELKEKYKEDL